MNLSTRRLENILVGSGHLSLADFSFAAKQAEMLNKRIEEVIVVNEMMSEKALGQTISNTIGLPFIDLTQESPPKELVRMLSPATMREHQVVVFGSSPDEKTFKLATSKLDSDDFIKVFEKRVGGKAEFYYAPPTSINNFIDKEYGMIREGVEEILEKFSKLNELKEDDAVEIIEFIIQRARNAMASDIHFNPLRKEVVVRFRIDGVVHPVATYPRKIHDRIVNRIKVLSNLPIDERMAFQDGRFDCYSEYDHYLSVRVSIIPVVHGESVVMRLLSEDKRTIFLEETGLSKPDLEKIKNNINRSCGMILCVGPSGAGKTTTIYGMVQLLNKPDVNVVTIEDPIEYSLEGVQQVQVDPKKNINFARGLRSLVRQDPDIMVVGEIRDQETAKIAVNSAMAGHLVLSSMHANDSATAFPRLMEMGIEPFLLSSSANLVVAQRLVRRICHACRESHYLSGPEMALLKRNKGIAKMIIEITGLSDLRKVRLYRGAGCSLCHNTGYLGRLGVFELLELSESIRSMLAAKASASRIRERAIKEGTTEMMRDGLAKVLMGETTLEELIREIIFS
jgi:type II secretory ATPase GspE/PulE/Tfp pilus assembly ATPase PilB-like protein